MFFSEHMHKKMYVTGVFIVLLTSVILITMFVVVFGTSVAAPDRLRIVGGNVTTIEKHPWQVSIQFLGVHFCGGSIISPSIIVTAAHCVTEIIATSYQIVAGTTNLSEETTVYRVDDYIVHDDFNSVTYDYDIAILRLTANLKFDEKIQPITLPDDDFEVPIGTPVIASGWGVTNPDDTKTSAVLRDVELSVVDWETCKTKLSSFGEVTERMLCAGYDKGGKDTCQADSGGALELNGTLVGIISWGHGCAKAGFPGVYTDVTHLRDWIRQHTGI